MRSLVGALAGALVALLGLRVTARAKERGVRPLDVLPELPEVLARDAKMMGEAARDAYADGQRAAEDARIRFDMQVVAHARRTRHQND